MWGSSRKKSAGTRGRFGPIVCKWRPVSGGRHLLVNTSRVNNIGPLGGGRKKNEHWPPPQYFGCFFLFKILCRFYLFILCFPLRVRLIDRWLLHVHPITVVIYAPRFFDFVQFSLGLGFPLSVSRTMERGGRTSTPSLRSGCRGHNKKPKGPINNSTPRRKT